MDTPVNNIRIDKICIDGLAKSLVILSPNEKADFDVIFGVLENAGFIWRDNFTPASSVADWYVSEDPEKKAEAIRGILDCYAQVASDIDETVVKSHIEEKIRTWFNV